VGAPSAQRHDIEPSELSLLDTAMHRREPAANMQQNSIGATRMHVCVVDRLGVCATLASPNQEPQELHHAPDIAHHN
jgi:hypothetical protein